MDGPGDTEQGNTTLAEKFREFIGHPDYPCLGAKAALSAGACELRCYGKVGDRRTSQLLAADLYAFIRSPIRQQSDFATFAALFTGPVKMTELEFERRLWRTLQYLNKIDASRFEWDATVDRSPANINFAFSFGGCAFYVVGMHGRSSRLARRFGFPALIFNAHEQFRKLRQRGKWECMKVGIRRRDRALQGDCNPMLDDFGERSEARQYSGRAAEDNWSPRFRASQPEPARRCPIQH